MNSLVGIGSKLGGAFAFLSLKETPRLNGPINSNLQCFWDRDLTFVVLLWEGHQGLRGESRHQCTCSRTGQTYEHIQSHSTLVLSQTAGSDWVSGTASSSAKRPDCTGMKKALNREVRN